MWSRSDAKETLKKTRSWIARRFASPLGKVVLGLIVLLIAARLAAPYVVKWAINERLADLDGYGGHVDDVDLSLYRGAYRIEGMQIDKTGKTEGRSVPLFQSAAIDISVQWAALLGGRIVSEVELYAPQVHFVSDVSGGEAQVGEGNDWRELGDDLIPLTVNRLAIRDGEIAYHDFQSHPRIDARLTEVTVDAHNLSTEQGKDTSVLPSTVEATAIAQGSGRVELHARLDPWDERPTFDLDLSLVDLAAPAINDLLRAYVGVDAEEGHVFLYTELSSRHGAFRGYVKPMVEGLSLWNGGEEGNFFDVVGDAIVQVFAEIFENHGTDRLAVRVPVSGTFESPSASGWAAVGSVLYNTLIEAIKHGLDDRGGWHPEPERHASAERGEASSAD
ncbi:MAG: DUF748 domain-containing protein [Sandaracinaceae bacterium]